MCSSDLKIAAAGLDVLGKEPIEKDNPLLRIKDSTKLASTVPHATCGVITSFVLSLILRSGLSFSIGSFPSTSSPAAAIFPCSSASVKSASLTIGPRPRF